MNLFDRKGSLVSTYIGKQEEKKIRDSIEDLEKEETSHEKILNDELSVIKKNKKDKVTPRSHG